MLLIITLDREICNSTGCIKHFRWIKIVVIAHLSKVYFSLNSVSKYPEENVPRNLTKLLNSKKISKQYC